MKDTPQVGRLITGDARRDAIHVAIAPVVAEHDIHPGQHLGVSGKTASCAYPRVGVADPFTTGLIAKGSRFYLFLYPNTVTSLRHDWAHPAFVEEMPATASPNAVSASIAWVKDFAAELSQTYESLMDAARLWRQHEEYTFDDFEQYKKVDYDKWPVFWEHYGVITSDVVPSDKRENTFFTCSC